LKAEFETWARLGNGRYFDAADAAQLGEALTETSAVRYTITDLAGNAVKSGSVSGQAIDLEPGIYNIVNQNGDVIYTNLVITPGSTNELIDR
ncbi:MAG: hypothetical protein AB8G95_21120, partial [Anaerolineae bacterium]